MDHNQLRQYIRSFSLDTCARGNQGYNRVLLQLFGYMGHGKSSFINSCKYVLEEQYNMVAEAGHGEVQSITMERRSFDLTGTIHIVDNRGFGLLNDFEMTEIYSQLANFLPLNERVDWTKSFDEIIDRIEESEPKFSYLIVPIFVYSSLMRMNEQEQTQVFSFLRTCHEMTGIYPTIIITNKSRRDPREMAEKFRLMGAGKVFTVENYTMEDHLPSRERHTNILDIIKNVLEDVNFLMETERNPQQDRKAFKKRLIKMAHGNVLAKMKQEQEEKIKDLESRLHKRSFFGIPLN